MGGDRTPQGGGCRSATPSLPPVDQTVSLSPSASLGLSPSPVKRSMIEKLQQEYPSMQGTLVIPQWAETEWNKDEARLYFETQGMIMPIRKPRNEDMPEARKRLLEERLHRRLKDVGALHAELGVVAARPLSTGEIHAAMGVLAGVQSSLSAQTKLPPRALKVLEQANSKLADVEERLRGILSPGAAEPPPPTANDKKQAAALSKRLMGTQAKVTAEAERTQVVQERLMAAVEVSEARAEKLVKAERYIEKLKVNLLQAESQVKKLAAKEKVATEKGYQKADDALRMRANRLFELEMRNEECREIINTQARKLRLLKGQLAVAQNDMKQTRDWAEKDAESGGKAKADLAALRLRHRAERVELSRLRQQLEDSSLYNRLLTEAGSGDYDAAAALATGRIETLQKELMSTQAELTELRARWSTSNSGGGGCGSRSSSGGHNDADFQGAALPSLKASSPQQHTEGAPLRPLLSSAESKTLCEPLQLPDEALVESPSSTQEGIAAATLVAGNPTTGSGRSHRGSTPPEIDDDACSDEEGKELRLPEIHDAELRALVAELGGQAEIQRLATESNEPTIRETARDALAMIASDQEQAQAGNRRPLTPGSMPGPGDDSGAGLALPIGGTDDDDYGRDGWEEDEV